MDEEWSHCVWHQQGCQHDNKLGQGKTVAEGVWLGHDGF